MFKTESSIAFPDYYRCTFQNVWPFDIVDPYPKTKSGFKYILTTICYFSRYPDAIPLKKVDEQSVASGMMVKIFNIFKYWYSRGNFDFD